MKKQSDENRKMNSIDMQESLIPGGNDDKYRTTKPMQYPDILDHKEHVFDYDTRAKVSSRMRKISKFLKSSNLKTIWTGVRNKGEYIQYDIFTGEYETKFFDRSKNKFEIETGTTARGLDKEQVMAVLYS